MQIIPLHMIAEGMVLAREVFRNDNSSNVPICGKNVVVTSELIRRFNMFGIKSLYVKGRPIVQEGEPTLATMLKDLDCRFDKVRNDPLTMKVHEIYTAFLKRSMGDDCGR
jgi:hypothetical protein